MEMFSVCTSYDIDCVDELSGGHELWTGEMEKRVEIDIVDTVEEVIDDPLYVSVNHYQTKCTNVPMLAADQGIVKNSLSAWSFLTLRSAVMRVLSLMQG
jgi:hypothetical protein